MGFELVADIGECKCKCGCDTFTNHKYSGFYVCDKCEHIWTVEELEDYYFDKMREEQEAKDE